MHTPISQHGRRSGPDPRILTLSAGRSADLRGRTELEHQSKVGSCTPWVRSAQHRASQTGLAVAWVTKRQKIRGIRFCTSVCDRAALNEASLRAGLSSRVESECAPRDMDPKPADLVTMERPAQFRIYVDCPR
jgi:hypothetical protein